MNYSTVLLCFVLTAIPPVTSCARTATQPAASARIEQVRGEVDRRRDDGIWAAVVPHARLHEGTELRTGADGTAGLVFEEGSKLQLGPDSRISLDALRNAYHEPLVWILLRRGEVEAQVSPQTTSKHTLSVHTPVTSVIVEGTSFSVSHEPARKLTTVAVREGVVLLQPQGRKLAHGSMYLKAGQQVSLTRSAIGPVVAVGAPPGLNEPALPYALLNLGQWQECEIRRQDICGTWTWDREAQRFDATWSNGESAVIKVVRLGDGKIVLTRADRSSSSMGRTARYVGRNAGTDFDGDVAVQLIAGEVTRAARGVVTKSAWRARSYYWVDMGVGPQQRPVPSEYDTNRPGSDYRNFELQATDPQACGAQCAAEDQCRAWTYVKPFQESLPRCWLKDVVPEPVGHTCCVSGVIAGR